MSTTAQAKSDTQIIVEHVTRPLQDAADALQSIAESLAAWVKILQDRYDADFPKLIRNPVTIGQAKYKRDEEANPEEQGDIFPSDGIGTREARLLRRQARQRQRGA
jgi:hypothetical protein